MAALSEIEKLEARWAENPDGRYFAPLADAYRKAGRVDDAIQVVTAGLNKHPDYLSAHIVLGRCFLEKKDDASARQAFERVLTLDTENIIALKSLAEISERTGDVPAARGWLQRLLVVDAMNAEAAEDLERLGGPVEAEAKPAEEAAPAISFMDLSEPAPAAEEAPAPRPSLDEASIPKTMERPAAKFEPPPPPQPPEPEPVKEPEPTPMLELEPSGQGMELSMGGHDAGPPLELEHASFQPPENMPAPPAPDVVPFDDQLAWGAGERSSQAISSADMPAAEEKHEAPAPAIEFMGMGEPTPGRSSESDIPSPLAGIDPNSSTLPLESVPPPPGWGAPVAPTAEAATVEMTPIRVPEPEPEPVAMAASEPMAEPAPAPPEAEMSSMGVEEAMAEATAPGAAELPLIMPEDVTPAEEMRRPSAKLVQMVSPEPEHEGAESGEPMVTETMGDLYLKQGFKDQAADVYRRLLAQRPGDAGLKSKLAAIETPVKMSATAMGTEAVGAWLKRIARAQLHVGAAAPAPAAPEPGPSPMEQAFATSEPEPAPVPQAVEAGTPAQGAPARQATDQYSLDQIFGGQSGGSAGAPREASSQAHTLGASFDEFFGSTQKQETVRPKEGGGGRQSEDDLSAFNAWLHGLKR